MADQNNINDNASEPQLRCGTVVIVGRPNVGKSTLLNAMVDEKVAIVSRVPQTTRQQIRGIYTDERGQIIFIDTPGIHKGKDKLDHMMNRSSKSPLDAVDCVIYLVDTTRPIGEEEQMAIDMVMGVRGQVILGLNKVDVKGADPSQYITFFEKVKGMPIAEIKNFTMIALSGLKKINIETLLDILFDYMPHGPMLYPADVVSDLPQRTVIADIIREKLFEIMREEIPHSLGVIIDDIQPRRKKTTYISATIFIERESQKAIVIGKSGETLKTIGSLARKELEELLETKVFLELYVKIEENWRDNIELLSQLGYESQ